MSDPIIEPTVGRIVLFRPLGIAGATLAAIVTAVQDVRDINIHVFPAQAHESSHTIENVRLLQQGDVIPDGSFAEWMPYQKGQAAKTEALEAARIGGAGAISQSGPAELTGRLANHTVAAAAPEAQTADQTAAAALPPAAAAAPADPNAPAAGT